MLCVALLAPIAVQAQSFAPTSLDFGDIPAHALSPAQTLTFTNTAGTPVELTDVSLVSLNAPLFGDGQDAVYFLYDLTQPESCVWRALGPDVRWTVLNPGETCTVSVRFNPTGTTITTYTGELTVSYNTSGGSPQTLTASLSGTATGPMECDPALDPLPGETGNANVNAHVTTSASELESARGGGSPPFVEVGQVTLFKRTVTAVSGCGSTYLGNPDDFSTWIALGPGDINVMVDLETVVMRYVESSSPSDAHSFLLLAGKEIKSDGPLAFTGDAHSNGKIDLKKGAPSTYDGSLSAVGDIRIDQDNTVTGDVLAGGTLELKKDARVDGTAQDHVSVDPVDLPALAFSAGGDDIRVKNEETMALPPGTYGKVTVEKEATLELAHDGTGGDYFFEELHLKKETNLLVVDATNGPVTLNIVEKVRFEKENEVTITGAPASPSRFLTINSLKDIEVKKEARLLGTLVAAGKVILDKDVWFRGAICAEEIDLKQEVVLLHHDAPEAAVDAIQAAEAPQADRVEAMVLAELPDDYALSANYPNPFNPATTIAFALPEAGAVQLAVYDATGREVARVVDGSFSAGQHQVRFDASHLSSGLYVYRMQAGAFIETRRMLLVK